MSETPELACFQPMQAASFPYNSLTPGPGCMNHGTGSVGESQVIVILSE